MAKITPEVFNFDKLVFRLGGDPDIYEGGQLAKGRTHTDTIELSNPLVPDVDQVRETLFQALDSVTVTEDDLAGVEGSPAVADFTVRIARANQAFEVALWSIERLLFVEYPDNAMVAVKHMMNPEQTKEFNELVQDILNARLYFLSPRPATGL